MSMRVEEGMFGAAGERFLVENDLGLLAAKLVVMPVRRTLDVIPDLGLERQFLNGGDVEVAAG